ncbi:TDP-N-acetylfucosamine:lipid II N-acetylfucosaminyltransferase [Pontibacter kalidii]|uniref:TDP-N-acetylfucosamine:lipid II N-acetylfucosaminyltransferase n=1 Tax=Pontibacter kalidii TaxID=2592049 RepID=UPI0022561FFA|nr:TDP-N-acetylfucosamine:lipid II N-acetylfucosaminyltransferase [Pontibacter kalidii]
MIFHFVVDEKVTDQVIENFDITDENVFVIFCSKGTEEFRHIRRSGDNVLYFDYQVDDINALVSLYKPEAVILHGLQHVFAVTILKLKKELTIGWYVWGFDIYGLPKIKPYIYAPLTSNLLSRLDKGRAVKVLLKQNKFIRSFYSRFIDKSPDYVSTKIQALKRISYCISYIKEDYDLFSQHYPNKLTFVHCALSSLDQYLANKVSQVLSKNAGNILIGNSNSFESNHLDVFDILNHNDCKALISNSKIYVPLSYGGNETYTEEVVTKGKSLFDNQFQPLLSFIDREEYVKILKTCAVGIFYHFRQQGMGNLIAMLYLGSRIYMSHKNPAYHFFVKNKVLVFELETDFKVYGCSQLSIEDREHNRLRLEDIFSKNKVATDVENLYKVLKRSKNEVSISERRENLI